MTPKLIQLTNLPRVMLVDLLEGDRFTADTRGIGGGECCTSIQDAETGEYIHDFDNWRIVSKLSEVTEEWCKGVVKSGGEKAGKGEVWYYDYQELSCFATALESLHSAIEAEGAFICNPYGKSSPTPMDFAPYCHIEGGNTTSRMTDDDWRNYYHCLLQWKSFQRKVINPEHTLILEMI